MDEPQHHNASHMTEDLTVSELECSSEQFGYYIINYCIDLACFAHDCIICCEMLQLFCINCDEHCTFFWDIFGSLICSGLLVFSFYEFIISKVYLSLILIEYQEEASRDFEFICHLLFEIYYKTEAFNYKDLNFILILEFHFLFF